MIAIHAFTKASLGTTHGLWHRDFFRRHWQKGLVDDINAHIIDLVDANNVAIATEQGQDSKQSLWEQGPRVSAILYLKLRSPPVGSLAVFDDGPSHHCARTFEKNIKDTEHSLG